jgi:outer membrane immunogenic protein
MKKILLASVATVALCSASVFAADMPVKAAPPAPVVNWTGCYIGGNFGGAWAHKSNLEINSEGTPVNDPLGSHTASGWAGGGQIGCDYQFNNNWVIGIRGMYDGADLTGNNLTGHFLAGDTFHTKVSSFGTAVAKIGYLLNPTLELYGLAGLAWVRDHHWESDITYGTFANANVTRTGYDVGVGLSWMFAHNWDLFLEYDHMGFGTKSVTLIGTPPGCTAFCTIDNIKQTVDKVLVGVDYRFDWGKSPVAAKY